MPNIGPLEIAIVLVIVLVVFGPKRLPELGKSMGNGIREFKGSISGEPAKEREAKKIAAAQRPQPAVETEVVGDHKD